MHPALLFAVLMPAADSCQFTYGFGRELTAQSMADLFDVLLKNTVRSCVLERGRSWRKLLCGCPLDAAALELI